MPHSFIIGQGLMPVPARCPIDGEKVDIGLGTIANGHGQLSHAVGSRLQGDALEPQVTEPIHSSKKPSRETNPRRECLSNSFIAPDL